MRYVRLGVVRLKIGTIPGVWSVTWTTLDIPADLGTLCCMSMICYSQHFFAGSL